MNRILPLSAVLLSPLIARAFQAEPVSPSGDRTGIPVAASFSAGVLNGEAKEHVYDYDNPDGSRRQLSRLDWDLSDIVMAGGQVSVHVLKDLSFNGGLWLAITEGNGEMDNYDWLFTGSSDPSHYSLSEVDVTEGYAFDINAAYTFLSRGGLELNAILGYKQNGWTWTDRGVYLLYPEYGPEPVPLYGANGIDYEQEFKMPYIGASANLSIQQCSLSVYLSYSPMVTATDWDHHIYRTIQFKETFEDGDMFGAGAELRYPINPSLFALASLDYQAIDLIVGDLEAYDYTTGEYYFGEDQAGIENEYIALTIGVGYHF